MSLPWTAQQCEWLRAMGHAVFVQGHAVHELGAAEREAAQPGSDRVGQRDGRPPPAPLPAARPPRAEAATPAPRGPTHQAPEPAPARAPAPEQSSARVAAATTPSAGLRTLHRALLRAAGQRTARAAEGMLAELGVDTAALRGDAGAKRALWQRLRTRRRQGSK
ncbi:hypothetical protein [Lysobacter sp. A3-1-A15]|uniref:hypothetical protein n=1 Tax=Novilysobacter viscosus TaxID=3098602 RepID=UPI0039831542